MTIPQSLAIWTMLVESDDRQARALIAEQGTDESLERLRSGPILDQGTDLARASTRWHTRLERIDPDWAIKSDDLGITLVHPSHPDWPAEAMAYLGDRAPLALWVRGCPSVLRDRLVAIVGSRAATASGIEIATMLAEGMTQLGHTIVSGGAYGIDAASHRGALHQERGRTLALFAGGVDRFYPRSNSGLFDEILNSGGALVSEYPPGSSPQRHRFLSRNWIIAALGLATIVVEAHRRSGAIATAHRAMSLGREAGAVPGPITASSSTGTNALLREGATCITSVEDIFELVAPLGATPGSSSQEHSADDDDLRRVLDMLDPLGARVLEALPVHRPAPSASIANVAGVTMTEVSSALGRLELDGLATSSQGLWRRNTQGQGKLR